MLEDAVKHLVETHDDVDLGGGTLTAVDLYDKKLLSLPIDLRRLDCPHCPVNFLCQGLNVLLRHVEFEHPGQPALPVSGAKYKCRSCGSELATLRGHGCAFRVNNTAPLLPPPRISTKRSRQENKGLHLISYQQCYI